MKKIFLIILIYFLQIMLIGCGTSILPGEEEKYDISGFLSGYHSDMSYYFINDMGFGVPILMSKEDIKKNIDVDMRDLGAGVVQYIYAYDYNYKENFILACEYEDAEKAAHNFSKFYYGKYTGEYFVDKNVVFWNTVATYYAMGNYVIDQDGTEYTTDYKKIIYCNSSDEDYIMRDSVEEVCAYAFSFCSSIRKITCSSNLKKIGTGAFVYMDNLEKVYLNESLMIIYMGVFVGCEKLDYVIIPGSVSYVYDVACYGVNVFAESDKKPFGWSNKFIDDYANVYWGNEWEYNEEGVPVVIKK